VPTLIDYFAITRIINLPERRDRREETREELRRNGLPFAPKAAFFEATRPASADSFPTLGTKGCFLSHLGVLRALSASGLPNVLVLEDDVRFEPKLLRGQAQLLAELDRTRWDVVYFGRLDGPVPEGKASKLRVLESGDGVMGLHCYAIKLEAARRFQVYLEACLTRPPGDPIGGPMHVDGALSMFRAQNPDIVTLIVEPYMADQRSSRTDIHHLASYENLPLLRTALSVARRARNAVTRVRRVLP
jgi:glycosyl transferase family 25